MQSSHWVPTGFGLSSGWSGRNRDTTLLVERTRSAKHSPRFPSGGMAREAKRVELSVGTVRIGGHVRAAHTSLEDAKITLIHVVVVIQKTSRTLGIILRHT